MNLLATEWGGKEMLYPLRCFWNNCFCIMRVLLRVSLLFGSTAHVSDMVHGTFALFYFFLLCVISLILGGWGWVEGLYDFLHYTLLLAWIFYAIMQFIHIIYIFLLVMIEFSHLKNTTS